MRGVGDSGLGCRGLSGLPRYMLGYSLFPFYGECNLMYIKISVTLCDKVIAFRIICFTLLMAN